MDFRCAMAALYAPGATMPGALRAWKYCWSAEVGSSTPPSGFPGGPATAFECTLPDDVVCPVACGRLCDPPGVEAALACDPIRASVTAEATPSGSSLRCICVLIWL